MAYKVEKKFQLATRWFPMNQLIETQLIGTQFIWFYKWFYLGKCNNNQLFR